jgi:hypothetical protein
MVWFLLGYLCYELAFAVLSALVSRQADSQAWCRPRSCCSSSVLTWKEGRTPDAWCAGGCPS